MSAANAIYGEPFSTEVQVGISLAVAVFWAILNLMRVDEQGWVNNFSALWQVTTTIAIVICLLAYPSSHNTNEFVWSSTNNDTGFPQSNFGYVVLLGLLMSTFAFSGYEAGAHMAEETTNASRVSEARRQTKPMSSLGGKDNSSQSVLSL